jgi:hypothetical protein
MSEEKKVDKIGTHLSIQAHRDFVSPTAKIKVIKKGVIDLRRRLPMRLRKSEC